MGFKGGISRWWFQSFFIFANNFHSYLGKIPILTDIFQLGWNHQLVCFFWGKESYPCDVNSFFHQCKRVWMVPILIWWELGLWKKQFLFCCFTHFKTWCSFVGNDEQLCPFVDNFFEDVDMFVECQLVFCCLLVFSYQSSNCQVNRQT